MGRGISSPVVNLKGSMPVEILITSQGYAISCHQFNRTATDTQLLNFTEEVL